MNKYDYDVIVIIGLILLCSAANWWILMSTKSVSMHEKSIGISSPSIWSFAASNSSIFL